MKKIRGEDRSVKPLLGQMFRTGYYQRDDKWEPEQIRELIEALQILDRAIYSGEMDSWDGGEHLWKTFSSVRKSMVHKPNEKYGIHLGINRIRHWTSCGRNINLRYLEPNRNHQIQTTETKLKKLTTVLSQEKIQSSGF